MEMLKEMGDRIKDRREAKDWSQERLADEMGVSQGTIWKWETGQVTDIRKLRKLAEQLETTEEWLETGNGVKNLPSLHGKGTKLSQDLPRNQPIPSSTPRSKVPVYGPAAAGSPEQILLTEDFIVEYADMPEELEGVKDGFKMYVKGDSMTPRHYEGEMVSVHPYRKPAIGQDCVYVEEPDGNAMIKRFVGETETEWKFAQYNPPKAFSVKKTKVRAIYSVVR